MRWHLLTCIANDRTKTAAERATALRTIEAEITGTNDYAGMSDEQIVTQWEVWMVEVGIL